jgi:hypothetical protein
MLIIKKKRKKFITIHFRVRSKNKLPILKVESPAPARRENAGISGICQKFHNKAGQDESASKM